MKSHPIGHIHKEILQAVVDALNNLDDMDTSKQSCGATVLSVMSTDRKSSYT